MFGIQVSRSLGCTLMRSLQGFKISSWAHSHTCFPFLCLFSSPWRIGSHQTLLCFPDSTATPSYSHNLQYAMPVLHYFMQHSPEHVFALMTEKSGVTHTQSNGSNMPFGNSKCAAVLGSLWLEESWLAESDRRLCPNSSVLFSVSQRNSRRIPGSNSLLP